MESPNTMFEAAVSLVKLGYPVFQLQPGVKQPFAKTAPNGFYAATNDIETVTRWWMETPDCNVGIRCAGIVVIDVDRIAECGNPFAGRTDFENVPFQTTPGVGKLKNENGEPIGDSPGRQYFFRKPAGKNWTCKTGRYAQNVDIKTVNGYVVAAPSVIGDKSYEWVTPLPPIDELTEPPADCQARIDEILTQELPPRKEFTAPYIPSSFSDDEILSRAEKYLDKVEPAIQGQSGHAKLLWAASCMVQGFQLDESTATRLLVDRYNPKCLPPWDLSKPSESADFHRKISEAIDKPLSKYPQGWLLENDTPKYSNVDISEIQKSVKNENRMATAQEYDWSPMHVWQFPQLLDADLSIKYLINDILVAGQPMILGGAKKSLKTSVMIDMAVSLVAGVPFLRKFEVPEKKRVLVMSGESGLLTLRDTVCRVAEATGILPRSLESLYICDSVPKISVVPQLTKLSIHMAAHKPDVLFLDPAYLMLDGEKAENVMIMGQQLATIWQLCRDNGATMVLLHHYAKTRTEYNRTPDLNDLSQSGFAEFARQWFLLGRIQPYVPGSGWHFLHFTVGGSVGHQGYHKIQVNEGVVPDRIWQVQFEGDTDFSALGGDILSTNAKPNPTQKDCDAIIRLLREHPEGVPKTAIREQTKFNDKKSQKLLDEMLERGDVVTEQRKSSNGKIVTYYKLATTGDEP